MAKEPIRVLIIDMTYDKETNTFFILVKKLDNEEKQTNLAIKGTDFGITPDIPPDIIEQFCSMMKGKEKNLHIHVDNETMLNEDKGSPIPKQRLDEIYGNLENYPIMETDYRIAKENAKKQTDEG